MTTDRTTRRTALGLSLSALAERAGVSRESVRRWEAGDADQTELTRNRIALALEAAEAERSAHASPDDRLAAVEAQVRTLRAEIRQIADVVRRELG